MGVPAGITVAFAGAPAQIPPGWTRVASLDARHTRGAAAGIDAGGIGGSVAHTHTSTPHGHTGAPHTHIPLGTGAGSGTPLNTLTPGAGAAVPDSLHAHSFAPTGATIINGASAAGPWNLVTIEPAYTTVIWLQSDGTPPGIPAQALTFWGTAIVPAGFTHSPIGSGGYLKGAISGRGGNSTGGSTLPHQHLASNHTHPIADHIHTSAGALPPATALTGSIVGGPPGGAISLTSHFHSLTVSAQTTTSYITGATVSDPSGTTALDPPFITLVALTPTVDAGTPGIICLWLGSIASIPIGWELCDGSGGTPDCRERFVKCAAALTDVTTTGGSATHTHSNPAAHQHSDIGHEHGTTVSVASGATNGDLSAFGFDSPDGHTHDTFGTAINDSFSYDTGLQDVQSATSLPPYTDVLYLQLVTTLGPGFSTPSSGQVFTDDTPTFVWSFFTISGSPQAAYRILIYAADGQTIIYNSGEQLSSSLSHTVPIGYLHNLHSYYARVSVTDAVGHFGLSALVPFSIAMIPPVTPAITATAEPLARPPDVLIAWTPPVIITGDTFNYYTVERRLQGTLSWQAIAQISNYTTASYRDYTGIPVTAYEYALTYTVTRTGDHVVSVEQSPAPVATLSFIGIWVHILNNPGIWLEYLANQEKVQPTQDQKLITVWGREKPTPHVGEVLYHSLQFGGVPEFYPTTTWQAGVIQFLKATVAQAAVLCVRMGQMQERYFCIIDVANTSRQDDLGVYETAIAFTEINYEETVLVL